MLRPRSLFGGFRDDLNLEYAGPQFAGDEQALAVRIIGDSVEHCARFTAIDRAQESAEIHPTTLPVCGEMRAMRSVCHTLAKISPSTNSNSFNWSIGRLPSRTVNRRFSASVSRSRTRIWAVPSLMKISRPLLARPHPSPE